MMTTTAVAMADDDDRDVHNCGESRHADRVAELEQRVADCEALVRTLSAAFTTLAEATTRALIQTRDIVENLASDRQINEAMRQAARREKSAN